MTKKRIENIVTTEGGYYLLSELITMKDRVLAQKLELLVWFKSPNANTGIVDELIGMLQASECDEDFTRQAQAYVDGCGIEFDVDRDGTVGRRA